MIALSSSGCGSENAAQTTGQTATSTQQTLSVDGGTTTSTAPDATVTLPPPPATTATGPSTDTPAVPTTTAPPADGGAAAGDPGTATTTPGGDEEGVRVPAAFLVSAGKVSPPQITVPPFLRIELRLTSGDGAAHRVSLKTPAGVTVDVPAGGRATQLVDGLAAGTYAVLVDGKDVGASVRAADDAGP